MILDGKYIADSILQELLVHISKLSVVPTLAVILVGDDAGSLSYIKQKQKTGEKVGIRVIFEHFPDTITPDILESAIAHYNADTSVHGLIIQRPVPIFIGETGDILNTVHPSKDVDGFLPHSRFEVPVAKAVISILTVTYDMLRAQQLVQSDFLSWLRLQHVAVVGRGETAGKPIVDLLTKLNCATSIIHSQTEHPEKIYKQASIIISCVGKKDVIKPSYISKGVILVSVGIWRDKEGKLHGDYESDRIQDIASFYTPTPGGVGPVNVASLMQNVLEAARLQST